MPEPTRTLALARGRRLPWGHRTLVMGILNATPDSFSDGGRLTPDNAAERAEALLRAGADLLDLGGESTRPGHAPVAAADELARVLPVLRAIRRAAPDAIVSIDTRKAEVAHAAVAAGADLLNDVGSLADPGLLAVAKEAGCALVLMRSGPVQGELLNGTRRQLAALVAQARGAGLADDQVVLDPGLGFGDPPGGDARANLALIRGVAEYSQGHPVLVGASRKRFLGVLTGVERPEQRVVGSVAAAVLAAQAGAAMVRVHDVAETVQALRVVQADG
ncbi:MAG: dihydropteroate synthase [Thermoplasmata archaeon]|jgi:dihydropteroate synthase|nr:dihydropteroate synthase [Thermoplasmata archaeon]